MIWIENTRKKYWNSQNDLYQAVCIFLGQVFINIFYKWPDINYFRVGGPHTVSEGASYFSFLYFFLFFFIFSSNSCLNMKKFLAISLHKNGPSAKSGPSAVVCNPCFKEIQQAIHIKLPKWKKMSLFQVPSYTLVWLTYKSISKFSFSLQRPNNWENSKGSLYQTILRMEPVCLWKIHFT